MNGRRPGPERAGRPRGPPPRKGREATTGRSLTAASLGTRPRSSQLPAAPHGARGSPGPGAGGGGRTGSPSAPAPLAEPRRARRRRRRRLGVGRARDPDVQGNGEGEGECQEVRAPRTCPAVRMRRAAAVQGKASAVLSALLPPPLEKGAGRGRRQVVQRAARKTRGRGHAAPGQATPSLKGLAPSREAAYGWLGSYCGGEQLQVNKHTQRPRLWAKNPARRRIPASRTRGGLAPGSKLFPSGQVPSLSCAFRRGSGARQAPQGLKRSTVIA